MTISFAVGTEIKFNLLRGSEDLLRIGGIAAMLKPIPGRLVARVAEGTFNDAWNEDEPNVALWIIRVEDPESETYGDLIPVAGCRLAGILMPA